MMTWSLLVILVLVAPGPVRAQQGRQCELCLKTDSNSCYEHGLRENGTIYYSADRISIQATIAGAQGHTCWITFTVSDSLTDFNSKQDHIIYLGQTSDDQIWSFEQSKHAPSVVFLTRNAELLTSSQNVDLLIQIHFAGNVSKSFMAITLPEKSSSPSSSAPTRVSSQLNQTSWIFMEDSTFASCVKFNQLFSTGEYQAVKVLYNDTRQGSFLLQRLLVDPEQNPWHQWIVTLVPEEAQIGQMPQNLTLQCYVQLHQLYLHGELSWHHEAFVPNGSGGGVGVWPLLLGLFLVMGLLVCCFGWLCRRVKTKADVQSGLRTVVLEQKKCATNPRTLSTSSSVTSAKSLQSTRDRLWSILSTISSSTSCSGATAASSHSEDDQDMEAVDEHVALQVNLHAAADGNDEDKCLLQSSLPDWTKKCRFYEYSRIEWGPVLGSGQFGIVFRAVLLDNRARWEVAIKAIRDNKAGQSSMAFQHKQGDPLMLSKLQSDLMKEGQIMADLGYHENIVNLQGITAIMSNDSDLSFFLVLEYCSNGALLKFLRNNRPKFSQALKFHSINANFGVSGYSKEMSNEASEYFNLLIAWSQQIANGMHFLSTQNFVHGDLAARNVLLTTDLTAKLSDFGLSSCIADGSARMRSYKLPSRWMAPETLLTRNITTWSDIWSYGVVLWEIFSLGSLPYEDLDNPDDLKSRLESGFRLKMPSYCPSSVWRLMTSCWQLDPAQRATFDWLSEELYTLLCIDYRKKYEHIVNEMHHRHVSIQNSTYFLMSGPTANASDFQGTTTQDTLV